jgi:hypothetical protein
MAQVPDKPPITQHPSGKVRRGHLLPETCLSPPHR